MASRHRYQTIAGPDTLTMKITKIDYNRFLRTACRPIRGFVENDLPRLPVMVPTGNCFISASTVWGISLLDKRRVARMWRQPTGFCTRIDCSCSCVQCRDCAVS